MTTELIRIDRATVTRPGGEVAFRDLSWALSDGQTWAVVGPVGSGKTTFAEVLLGRLPVRSGSITWPLLGRARAAGRRADFPSDVIRLVGFKEESRLFSYRTHYYQERFNFTDPLDDLTLGEYLRASGADEAAAASAAGRLGVGGLLGASFLALSNGQVRRARIAKAVLGRPELLILDEPFLGLDAAGRSDVAALLGGLVAAGTRVLLITRPEAVPEWATHVLELDASAVRRAGPLGRTPSAREGVALTPSRTLGVRPDHPSPPAPLPQGERGEAQPVIDLRDVTVRYGPKVVLDRVSWAVRVGERWAVLGPNGSGKTTLLSLVCGDHPQAYANRVSVFGRQRGTGESIWDVKRRIGLVSPELHLYFTEPLTAFRTAATGFFDGVTDRPTTPDQDDVVRRLFAEFGLTDLADRPFARLSTGQQRLVLLVRALVKGPELLILDEPFQGLDRPAVEHARGWLDANLTVDQTLVFVSHYEDEIPRSVTRALRLDRGRAVTPTPKPP